MLGYLFIALMFLVGYFAYRGSGKIGTAILAGLALPLFAMLIFGIIVGRPEFENMARTESTWPLIGAVVIVCGMVVYGFVRESR